MYQSTKSIVSRQFGLIAVIAVAVACWYLLLRYQPAVKTSPGVLVWWTALCAISVFNIWMWRLSAAALGRRKNEVEPSIYLFQRRQLLLCGCLCTRLRFSLDPAARRRAAVRPD